MQYMEVPEVHKMSPKYKIESKFSEDNFKSNDYIEIIGISPTPSLINH